MTCKQLGLAFDEIGKIPFQRCRDTGMQLLTAGAQQGGDSGVLHQSVLKQIRRLRCDPAAEQQPRFGKSVKSRSQRGARSLRNLLDQVKAERTTNNRANLRDFFGARP